MRLSTWQDAFTQLLSGDRQPLSTLISQNNDPSFSAAERLNVYRNNYQQGMIGHLRQTFERCNNHVGEQYFTQLANSYLAQYPPQTTGLANYGQSFPQHLDVLQKQRPELEDMPYLADLAHMDWLCDQIYYSPTSTSWPQAAFNELTADQQAEAQLLLAPDCRLLHSHWPLHQLWELQAGRLADTAMSFCADGEHLLIARNNYRIHPEQITAGIYHLLSAIQQGDSLHTLAENFPEHLNKLPALIMKGWISNFALRATHA